MKKLSSNGNMGEHLNLFKTINQVDVSDRLYGEILSRIADQKVPMSWIKMAAAILLLLLSINVFVLYQSNQTEKNKSLTTLIPLTDNTLYYE